jgi:V/A-type H+-transporting ATPase subunit C
MSSQVRRYAFINAKLRARLTKLLDEKVIDRIIEAPTIDDALLFLRGTSFSALENLFNTTGDFKAGELELFRQEVRLYIELKKYVDGEVLEIVRALALNYEIETLKNALRLFFDRTVRGRSVDDQMRYLFTERIEHEIDTVKIAAAENLDRVVALLSSSPYADIVDEHREEVVGEKTLFPLEIALDRFYHANLLEKTGELRGRDREVALRLIRIEIDLLNINWIIRFRSMYKLPLERALQYLIPSGFTIDQAAVREAYASEKVIGILQGIVKKKYPSLAALLNAPPADTNSRLLLIERILHEILMIEVEKILSGYPFSIGIVLAYFILKRNEIRRLAAVLNAKQYRLAKQRIREAL